LITLLNRKDTRSSKKRYSLLEKNKHDFLAVYNDEYDNLLHKTHPYSIECLEALRHHNDAFLRLYKALVNYWEPHNWLLVYAPDHGAHFNEVDKVAYPWSKYTGRYGTYPLLCLPKKPV